VDVRGRLGATVGLALAALFLLAPAAAAQPAGTPGSTAAPIGVSEDLPSRPDGYAIGAGDAIRIANLDPKVGDTRERYGKLEASAEAKPPSTWQVGYFADDREVAQVLVDDPSATVRESWTGDQVAWQMARGYEGSFGHKLNAPYVWLPLCALFLLGLIEWRRPWRLVHLDLLVLLGFGASHVFFNRGEIGASVPLAYPVLLYLLGRMLWIGFRGAGPGLRPTAPIVWLAVAAAFLVGFRIALNVADSGVIDVGYSGVVGADRAIEGEPLYGEGAFPDDNTFGDTYGPVNYYAYVPFEQALPWSGSWDELPAAHAAAILFDLAVLALLLMLGRRMRGGREGRDLGVVLAFAWAAYPYTDYVLQSNANDSLVAALVLAALILIASPVGRGAMTALAGLTKFAPFALAPLFAAGPRAGLLSPDPATGEGPFAARRVRALVLFALALVAVSALAMTQTLIDAGLSTFWDRTIDNQVNRESPFSIWGQEPDLDWLRTALMVVTAALAVLVAFLPRRRTLTQIAALAAAILIALQLTAQHWFYLYIVWFFPLAIAALVTAPSRRRDGESPPDRPADERRLREGKRPAPAVPAGAGGPARR
jgi:Glycosyltransferase family 87